MVLGILLSTRILPQCGDKKPPPDESLDGNKPPVPSNIYADSTPLSTNELFHRFSEMLNALFDQFNKILNKDADSKSHNRVDDAFQFLKDEHDSKWNDVISITSHKAIEQANDIIHHMKTKVNTTMPIKLENTYSEIS